MSERLTFTLTDKTITALVNPQESGQLNLQPSFQRDSVWKPLHHRKFILTILDGYPVPSIFLYSSITTGRSLPLTPGKLLDRLDRPDTLVSERWSGTEQGG
jgi:hypothetical protein